ncbi:MAG: hypothetical protein E7665_04110 [Ruminococcaceae bacterium]|nr:hypothetical protein [Oscillospiraceae bacterium]
MRNFKLIYLLFAILFLTSCDMFPYTVTSEYGSESTDGLINDTEDTYEPTVTGNIGDTGGTGVTTEEINEPDPSETDKTAFPEDFVFPVTDGSTSTTNLDNAVREAVSGNVQKAVHTKTYTSFENLLQGKCDMIFTTPLSASQLKRMETEGFKHVAEPVAGEGFVFVVNKDNTVDTLTEEQLKGIYSGKITNWKELGGNDAEIIAYQRNADSGSQNYMISFMGDTPLMEPVTDIIPATMSGILDVVAGYDNGINAIGYSVYAYSDGMYENISEIKYIKVNGVEPSLSTFADGSYPLLGYNYAVFSADEEEGSNVRTLVRWMQSDEGQQVIANAGYVPYRKVEGLTLPEVTTGELYSAEASSGIKKPEKTADYYYTCYGEKYDFSVEGLNEAVEAFFEEAEKELSSVDRAGMQEFLKARNAIGLNDGRISTNIELINGYLSAVAGICYWGGAEDSPNMYYEVRTAVFDIYTGKRLELSDLFFEGVDFVKLLNIHLANEAEKPYSGYGSRYDMLHDFRGLYNGEFTFTADRIIFKPNTCFVDGVSLSFDKLSEYMVTSIPRDMNGLIDSEYVLYKNIREGIDTDVCSAETKDGITVYYLDRDKVSLSSDVCDKVNAFVTNTFEKYFTQEKLCAAAKSKGVETDRVILDPWSDFGITVVGERYIEFNGYNAAMASDKEQILEFYVIEDQSDNFRYFFDAKTGEELRIDSLFKEGWKEHAEYYVSTKLLRRTDEKYTSKLDTDKCRVMRIGDYAYLSPSGSIAVIYLKAENGDLVSVTVPSEYIK